VASSKLDEARRLLAKRLEEIDRERKQLTAAIEQLDGLGQTGPAGNGRRSSRRSTRSRRTARKAGKRAPRGEREKQLLSSIKAHPDYRVADHAREVGVSPQQLYPLLNRLASQDKIVKKDSKYVAKS
jgi:hypothetical protein